MPLNSDVREPDLHLRDGATPESLCPESWHSEASS